MKKILFVEQYQNISGAEIIALNTLKILKKHFNIQIVSILPLNRGDLYNKLLKLDSQIYFYDIPPVISKEADKKKVLCFFKNIIKKENISLIYSNMIRAGYYSAKIAKHLQLPFIWHLNETIPKIKLLYILPLLNNLNVFPIAVSPTVKKSFILNKIKVIENPISDKIKYKEDFNLFNFGYLGRLIPAKGVHNALIRFSEILEVFPQAYFFIYGDERNINSNIKREIKKISKKFNFYKEFTSYTELLKNIIHKLKLENKIIFKGFEKDLNIIFKDISVLTVPSTKQLNEAFGLTAFEAMRAGRLVFTSNNGSFKDYISNGINGFKIDFKKRNSLKNIILNLNNSPELLYEIRKNGFNFSKKFSEKNFNFQISFYFSKFLD